MSLGRGIAGLRDDCRGSSFGANELAVEGFQIDLLVILYGRAPTGSARADLVFNDNIPRSRHNPKILGVDDAEIVGDRITEVRPIPRNFFTQETERRIGKLGASCVALVVRDMLVHHAP